MLCFDCGASCKGTVINRGGGATDPIRTPSTLWVVVMLLLKHLPSMWITAVVSLHSRLKHLPSTWINVVVSLQTHVKHLPSTWIIAVVSLHTHVKHLPSLWVYIYHWLLPQFYKKLFDISR